MDKFLRIDLFVILAALFLTSTIAEAQNYYPRASRMANSSASGATTYIEFYEFEDVDVQPAFPGGEHGLIHYINNTREYPYKEYIHHCQGRVLCSFIIGTDGRVSHVQVIRSSGYEALDREAVRVIKKMPKWEAGKLFGTKVNVRCTLPIAFRL